MIKNKHGSYHLTKKEFRALMNIYIDYARPTFKQHNNVTTMNDALEKLSEQCELSGDAMLYELLRDWSICEVMLETYQLGEHLQ